MEDNLQENGSMDEFLPLRDVVFKTLRMEILTGKLKPGERLMEIHLADRLGVSRTPIREAMRKLELEGLVTMVPRKGAEVAQITAKSLSDVLEVREALDALAIELACDRISEAEIEVLKDACDYFKQVTKTGDAAKIARADVIIHDIIVKASRNDKLVQMANNLAEQMYRYRFEHIKDASQHPRLIVEHEVIYESLLARDKQKAAEAVKKHIDNQEAAIMQQLT